MKKFLVAMGLAAFAFVGCDDSSSASAGPNDEPGVESSSSVEQGSSSSKKAKSSSSVSQSDAKQSSSSEKSSSSVNDTSSSSVKSGVSSSSGDTPKSYAEAKVLPSGTYDCMKYKCASMEYLNHEFLEAGRYGEILDERDNQVYKTVQIGDQIWMAENLNFAYIGVPYTYYDDTSDSTSWCYDNDPANCTKYGRLYTWAAAMDSVKTGCGFDKTCGLSGIVQGICPTGWHLPDSTEWETLITAVGGGLSPGEALKLQSGWLDDGNGTDAFGFSALPAGYRDILDGAFNRGGDFTVFWTATEVEYYACSVTLNYFNGIAFMGGFNKGLGHSVRCVKDE